MDVEIDTGGALFFKFVGNILTKPQQEFGQNIDVEKVLLILHGNA
jgi:hypothetical protein